MCTRLRRRKATPKLPPEQDATSIGNLVLRSGLCSKEELSIFIEERNQSTEKGLLGMFLVSKKVLTEEMLEILLLRQAAERNGGVEAAHVVRALEIEGLSRQRVKQSLERLTTATHAALAKAKV